MSRFKDSKILLLIAINIVLVILFCIVDILLSINLWVDINLEYTQKLHDHAVYLLKELTDDGK